MPAGRPGRRGAGGRAVRRAAGTLPLTALLLLAAAGGGRRGGAAAAPGEDPARCPEDRFVDVEEVPGFTEGRKRQGGCACEYVHISELTEELYNRHYNEKRIPLVVSGALDEMPAVKLWSKEYFETRQWEKMEAGAPWANADRDFRIDPPKEGLRVGSSETSTQAFPAKNLREVAERSDPCEQAAALHRELYGVGKKRGKKLKSFMQECVEWNKARQAFLGRVPRTLGGTVKEVLTAIMDPDRNDTYGWMLPPSTGFDVLRAHEGLRKEWNLALVPGWLRGGKVAKLGEHGWEDGEEVPNVDLGTTKDRSWTLFGLLNEARFEEENDSWGWPTVYVGAAGSRTLPHIDGIGGPNAWFAVVKGTKLVNLWPPEIDYNATFGASNIKGAGLTVFNIDPFNKVPPQLKSAWGKTGRSFMDEKWDPGKYNSFGPEGGGNLLPPMAPGQCLVKSGEILIATDAVHSVLNTEPTIGVSADQLDRYSVVGYVWRRLMRGVDRFMAKFERKDPGAELLVHQPSGVRIDPGQYEPDKLHVYLDLYRAMDAKCRKNDVKRILGIILEKDPDFWPQFLAAISGRAKYAQRHGDRYPGPERLNRVVAMWKMMAEYWDTRYPAGGNDPKCAHLLPKAKALEFVTALQGEYGDKEDL